MINFNGTTLTEVIYNGTNLDSVWFCDRTAGTCTEVFSKPKVYIKLNSVSYNNSYCYISTDDCQTFEGTFRDVNGTPIGLYCYDQNPSEMTFSRFFFIYDSDAIRVGCANIDYCSNVPFIFSPSVTDYTREICMLGCGRTTDIGHWPGYANADTTRGYGESISLPAKSATTNCTIYPTSIDMDESSEAEYGGSLSSTIGTVCIWLTDMSVTYNSVNITACGITCSVSMTDLQNGVTLYFSNN